MLDRLLSVSVVVGLFIALIIISTFVVADATGDRFALEQVDVPSEIEATSDSSAALTGLLAKELSDARDQAIDLTKTTFPTFHVSKESPTTINFGNIVIAGSSYDAIVEFVRQRIHGRATTIRASLLRDCPQIEMASGAPSVGLSGTAQPGVSSKTYQYRILVSIRKDWAAGETSHQILTAHTECGSLEQIPQLIKSASTLIWAEMDRTVSALSAYQGGSNDGRSAAVGAQRALGGRGSDDRLLGVLLKGASREAAGCNQEAIALFNQAEGLAPKRSEAFYFRALTRLAAYRELSSSKAERPENVGDPLPDAGAPCGLTSNDGRDQSEAKDMFNSAIADFQSAERLSHPSAFLDEGMALVLDQDLGKISPADAARAEVVLRRALVNEGVSRVGHEVAQRGRLATAYVGLGIVRLVQKKFELMRGEFAMAAKLLPDRWLTAKLGALGELLYGESLAQSQRFKEARRAIEGAVDQFEIALVWCSQELGTTCDNGELKNLGKMASDARKSLASLPTIRAAIALRNGATDESCRELELANGLQKNLGMGETKVAKFIASIGCSNKVNTLPIERREGIAKELMEISEHAMTPVHFDRSLGWTLVGSPDGRPVATHTGASQQKDATP